MIQLLRKCLYIFQLKVIPQSVKNLVLCGYWNHIKVRGHIELRTTFTDGTASRTANIRYLIVNAPSTYNILLERPALNRI